MVAQSKTVSPSHSNPLEEEASLDVATDPRIGNARSKKDATTGENVTVNETSEPAQTRSRQTRSRNSDQDDGKSSLPEQKAKTRDASTLRSISDLTSESSASFFHRDAKVSFLCRDLIAQSYAQQTKLELGSDARGQFIPSRRKGLPPIGPLSQIEISPLFDTEQLWEELELRNKPLLSHLRRRVTSLRKQNEEKERALKRATVNDEPENELSGNEEDESDDLEMTNGLRKDSEDMHSSDCKTKETGVRNESEVRGETLKRHRVRFDLKDGHQGEARSSEDIKNLSEKEEASVRKKGKSSSLEDGFFNVGDMEHFADEAENLAFAGKLMASDDDRDSDENSESLGAENQATVEERNARDYTYSDFFDPPSKLRGKSLDGSRKVQLLEDDEMSEAEDGDEDCENENSRSNVQTPDIPKQEVEEMTPLQKSREKAQQKIETMEEASVGKKSWELRGEVSGFARPKDSLLVTDMKHDIAVKPKTLMGDDMNQTIEDIIKQRIVDRLFDDVVMAFPEDYISSKKKKSNEDLPEISQEKPTEGLADIYAREFTEEREKKSKEMLASRSVQKQADEVLTDEQREVNKLFDKLSKKLDALSSLHFTPLSDVIQPEPVTGANVKAIALEEAIPEAVSDATLLAPKEVFTVDKKGPAGDLEISKSERRANRRRKKSKKRKMISADDARKEVIAQTNPLLAEKKRAEDALVRRGKKPRLADKDPTVVGQRTTRDLLKRFGAIKAPDEVDSVVQTKKYASHLKL